MRTQLVAWTTLTRNTSYKHYIKTKQKVLIAFAAEVAVNNQLQLNFLVFFNAGTLNDEEARPANTKKPTKTEIFDIAVLLASSIMPIFRIIEIYTSFPVFLVCSACSTLKVSTRPSKTLYNILI
uniref:Uncharacterized protein n=1 Tax=Rhizophora mucronata TaxID=61149 RepID=A0A2P2J8A3_RHIMU